MQSLTPEERKKYGHPCPYAGQSRPNANEIYKKVSISNTGKKQSDSQKLKNSLNKKGTIHMTNGIDDVMIKPEREQEFIKLGYHRGRSKNRKSNKRSD